MSISNYARIVCVIAGLGAAPLAACFPSVAFDDTRAADGGGDGTSTSAHDATTPGTGSDGGALSASDSATGNDADAAPLGAFGTITIGDQGFTCALHGGTVKCWGSNADFLARDTDGGVVGPGPVRGPSGGVFDHPANVTARDYTACATRDGLAYCWGGANYGARGRSTGPSGLPVNDGAPLTGILDLTTGASFSCARRASDVWCWGLAERGQLAGAASPDAGAYREVPTLVPSLAGVAQIAAGYEHGCAVKSDGHVACWGRNDLLQSGSATSEACGTSPCVKTPTVVAGITAARRVAAGGWHSCAVDAAGHVFCWGANDYAQLGVTVVDRTCHDIEVANSNVGCTEVAMRVAGVEGATNVAVGGDTSCALAGGRVLCWGANANHQLGRGEAVGDSSADAKPVEVAPGVPLEGAVDLAVGLFYACARVSDGGAYCWGSASGGGLGAGPGVTEASRAVRVQL